MKSAIIIFPGSNRERDMDLAMTAEFSQPPLKIWHGDSELPKLDLIVIPGGFSYGDYLRAGCMAAHSPIIKEVKTFAENGVNVLGICNGFQILTEMGLLPGVLMRNASLKFICKDVNLKVEQNNNPFLKKYKLKEVFRAPIAHRDGNYFADEASLDELEDNNRVALRYCGPSGEVNSQNNPNGSQRNIAGIFNKKGNVLGMMPHPEDAVEKIFGGLGGKPLFEGLAAVRGN